MNNAEVMDRIKAFLDKHNPCNFHKIDGVVKCAGERNNFTPCCHGCRHLTANGCGLSDANMCRMYLCPSAWRRLSIDQQTIFTLLCELYDGPLYFRSSELARHTENPMDYGSPGRQMTRSKPPFIW